MKKILFLFFTCLSAVCAFATTGSQYVVDDQQVEQLFTNSVDVSLTALSEENMLNTSGNFSAAYYRGTDKNFVAAILLNFFLGWAGIHRLYLGTETLTWVGYLLTCGGLGVVAIVDFVVLIVHNEDISPYVDNPKFFMWASEM